MAYHYNKELKDEIEATKKEAENLIKTVLPERIQVIKELLASPDFGGGIPPTSETGDDLKELERKAGGGDGDGSGNNKQVIPVNPLLLRLHSTLKPYYAQMYKDFRLIKQWLSYSIPKVEDGNNFGVEVLNSVLGKMEKIEAIADTFTYVPRVFSEARAKAVKKAIKHPLVEDYKFLVQQVDECNINRLRNDADVLYHSYLRAYDILLKNIEKVTQPRNVNNTENLY